VEELGRDRPDLSGVRGICYREGEEVRCTPGRPLVEDLGRYPVTADAYELLKMDLYRVRYLFGGITVEGSRGCMASCNFCSFWTPCEKP
jgi:radical SAM superfamily enzyme YgiQ (UPF0313 family)